MNKKSIYVCFSIRLRKLTNAAANLAADLIPMNNFFAHWVKEIDVATNGGNKSLIQRTTLQEIYRYSESMLKHLQKEALKMIQNNLL